MSTTENPAATADSDRLTEMVRQLVVNMSAMQQQLNQLTAAQTKQCTVGVEGVTDKKKSDDRNDEFGSDELEEEEPVPTRDGVRGQRVQHGAPHREERTVP